MGTLTLGPRLFDDLGTGFDEPAVQTMPEPQAHPILPQAHPILSPGHRRNPAGGSTLEDVIVATWEHIAAGAAASCPVCHGRLQAVRTGGSGRVNGRCQDCGSHLS
ncbi:MAG TPA: hypothetical protein VG405_11050 [Solirubrobacteraceae bacterium]|jgi:hypothetical protein|nr:hypothetical protein [Solirubrobacteraceae bacterium]